MKTNQFEEKWLHLQNQLQQTQPTPITFQPGIDEAIWTESFLVKKGVPSGYGVYVVYGVKTASIKELLYIGKSGTMCTNGFMRKQGIAKRLTRTAFAKGSHKVTRFQLFDFLVDKNADSPLIADRYSGIHAGAYESLSIKWIETYNDNEQILPAYAEAVLISAFFAENNCLPPLNREF